MHIQVVNFQLKDLSQEAYEAMCAEVASTFAAVPGLISKVWLADPATNTYGGVYTWESREAYEAFTRSELFAETAASPNFAGISSRDFAILEGPTRVTHGMAAAAV